MEAFAPEIQKHLEKKSRLVEPSAISEIQKRLEKESHCVRASGGETQKRLEKEPHVVKASGGETQKHLEKESHLVRVSVDGDQKVPVDRGEYSLRKTAAIAKGRLMNVWQASVRAQSSRGDGAIYMSLSRHYPDDPRWLICPYLFAVQNLSLLMYMNNLFFGFAVNVVFVICSPAKPQRR